MKSPVYYLGIAAAMSAGTYEYGNVFQVDAPQVGSLFHHSGASPSSHKRNRNPRRNKRGERSRRKLRILARRANPHGW